MARSGQKERGPRALGGVTEAGTGGELPQIDYTVGARQRFRVHVPTEDSTLLLGARVKTTPEGGSTTELGYDGINAITQGHLFFSSSAATATLQSAGRVYVVSLTSSLAAIAHGELLVGSARSHATLAAKKSVSIISGYGPSAQTVTLYGTDPESPSHADLTEILESHEAAALVTTGAVGVISAALFLLNTPRAAWASSIAAYVLLSAGLLSGFKSIVEGATRKSLTGGGLEDDALEGVGIHGKKGVTITTGTGPGTSISMFAPAGSFIATGAISAGMTAGLSTNISGILAASITGLASASMQAIHKTSVVSMLDTAIESRIGSVTLRGPKIDVGAIAPASPQAPTLAVSLNGAMTVDAKAGALGTTAVSLSGLTQSALVKAVKSISLEVLPFVVEVSPLGVTIKNGVLPVVQITPTGIKLLQTPTTVEVAPTGVKVVSGPTMLELSPAIAQVTGTKVLIG